MRKPECNYDKDVLDAASQVMWNALRNMLLTKEITLAQAEAWRHKPASFFGD